VAAKMLFVFFFFQAEDGIRDLTVTGVQTCALPISPSGTASDAGKEAEVAEADDALLLTTEGWVAEGTVWTVFWWDGDALRTPARSEERRVGEEGRSRWSPDH